MRGRLACSRLLTTTIVLSLLSGVCLAQFPPQIPALPAQQPPLFYVRLVGPKGMKATLYRGEAIGVAMDTPCVVGFRPGYAYRVALSHMAEFPGAVFSPTIEVRGSLWLGGQLRNADFPANVIFRAEDFANVEHGALITKLVVLERPDTAEPVRSRANEPIEIPVRTARDLYQESQARGAPLATIMLGQRTLSAEELAAASISGTILLPGEKSIASPRFAPWVPWACYPLFDPRHGPAPIADYMHLPDGGDSGLRAGHDGYGRLRGLDPSDTVAEYRDAKGQPRVIASNRVALCVPRYVILRNETGLASQTVAFGPGSAHANTGGAVFSSRLPFVEHSQPTHLQSAAMRLKASGTQFTAGTAVTGRVNGLETTTTLRSTNSLDGSCPPPAVPTLDRPLRIIKWPDKQACNIGDLVMFSLKYTNQGSQPITNLVVSDSLTTRFEYVSSSQKTDREAAFTMQPNEAGSTILRWEFPVALQPGESGLITFQVRIR